MCGYARHALVVCEAHPGHGEAIAEELVEAGYEVRRCLDEESLIEAVSLRAPRAVVYELRHQLPVDLAILALLRRVIPGVPLVLLTSEVGGGPTLRALRAMRPAVLAQEPVGRDALHAAVRTAVRRGRTRARRAPTATGARRPDAARDGGSATRPGRRAGACASISRVLPIARMRRGVAAPGARRHARPRP